MAGAEQLFGHDAQRLLERSFSAFRAHKWRARRRLRGDYRRVTETLYRTIADVAGASCVVDTAHFPLRARELQALEGIDLYLIFLIRDPQSVVASFNLYLNRNDATERRLRVLGTNANLWLTHALATLVFLRQPRARRMLLRHEDFLADPPGMLRAVLDWSGSSSSLPDLASLQTGFPINGNRFLRDDVVSLEPRVSTPRRDSRITALLQLPWRPIFSRLRPLARAAP
ncbi:MAG TPA: sulfotransferase [Polyangiales bacterium]|nr:sulfotransferase [Polyangiales bacterium]